MGGTFFPAHPHVSGRKPFLLDTIPALATDLCEKGCVSKNQGTCYTEHVLPAIFHDCLLGWRPMLSRRKAFQLFFLHLVLFVFYIVFSRLTVLEECCRRRLFLFVKLV